MVVFRVDLSTRDYKSQNNFHYRAGKDIGTNVDGEVAKTVFDE